MHYSRFLNWQTNVFFWVYPPKRTSNCSLLSIIQAKFPLYFSLVFIFIFSFSLQLFNSVTALRGRPSSIKLSSHIHPTQHSLRYTGHSRSDFVLPFPETTHNLRNTLLKSLPPSFYLDKCRVPFHPGSLQTFPDISTEKSHFLGNSLVLVTF